jgi:hypothetical protein
MPTSARRTNWRQADTTRLRPVLRLPHLRQELPQLAQRRLADLGQNADQVLLRRNLGELRNLGNLGTVTDFSSPFPPFGPEDGTGFGDRKTGQDSFPPVGH